jgi:hypothetical protein
LSWNAQVNQVTKKVNAGLIIVRRLREILDYRTRITIISINYSTTRWLLLASLHGVVYRKMFRLSDILMKLPNGAFRIITRESFEIRSADILKNAGVSHLQARREHQLALLMFIVKNKMLPNHLTEIFTNTNSIHTQIREIANLISHYLSQRQTIWKRRSALQFQIQVSDSNSDSYSVWIWNRVNCRV